MAHLEKCAVVSVVCNRAFDRHGAGLCDDLDAATDLEARLETAGFFSSPFGGGCAGKPRFRPGPQCRARPGGSHAGELRECDPPDRDQACRRSRVPSRGMAESGSREIATNTRAAAGSGRLPFDIADMPACTPSLAIVTGGDNRRTTAVSPSMSRVPPCVSRRPSFAFDGAFPLAVQCPMSHH
jgi:hypothetical protein